MLPKQEPEPTKPRGRLTPRLTPLTRNVVFGDHVAAIHRVHVVHDDHGDAAVSESILVARCPAIPCKQVAGSAAIDSSNSCRHGYENNVPEKRGTVTGD